VLLADGREPRLPVAHLGLERLDLLRGDVRWVRDDEVVPAGEALPEVALLEPDLEPGRRRVLARQRQRLP
jgi:hypothetical protein